MVLGNRQDGEAVDILHQRFMPKRLSESALRRDGVLRWAERGEQGGSVVRGYPISYAPEDPSETELPGGQCAAGANAVYDRFEVLSIKL